jgi:hypothetical protein
MSKIDNITVDVTSYTRHVKVKKKQFFRPNLKSNLTYLAAKNTATIHTVFHFNVYSFQFRKAQRYKDTSHFIFQGLLGISGNKNDKNSYTS